MVSLKVAIYSLSLEKSIYFFILLRAIISTIMASKKRLNRNTKGGHSQCIATTCNAPNKSPCRQQTGKAENIRKATCHTLAFLHLRKAGSSSYSLLKF